MGNLLVDDLMTPDPVTVDIDDNLATVMEVMDEFRIRHVPVVQDGNLAGLISHRDLLRATTGLRVEDTDTGARLVRTADILVRNVMTTVVDRIDTGSSLQDAATLMFENKLGCLPVVEGDHVVGILTESDFVRHFADPDS